MARTAAERWRGGLSRAHELLGVLLSGAEASSHRHAPYSRPCPPQRGQSGSRAQWRREAARCCASSGHGVTGRPLPRQAGPLCARRGGGRTTEPRLLVAHLMPCPVPSSWNEMRREGCAGRSSSSSSCSSASTSVSSGDVSSDDAFFGGLPKGKMRTIVYNRHRGLGATSAATMINH